MVCQRMILDGAGLFCGNFSSSRGSWSACQKVWCGKCYKPLDQDEFPIAKPTDEDGVVSMDSEDQARFIQARDGDFLLTPFQCDLCHFRNLLDSDPVGGLAQDVRLLKLIRRANLDALWSREPGTVSSTLLLCRQGGRIAKSLGIRDKIFRPMGPHLLDDTFGMGAAVVMLQQLLNPGKHDKTIQFATVRKMRAAFSNAYHATAKGSKPW